jgi:hypothetical protein
VREPRTYFAAKPLPPHPTLSPRGEGITEAKRIKERTIKEQRHKAISVKQ